MLAKISQKSKVIAILGPTSSGKTSLAVQLAQELNGEIVSVDSRQVYRGLDIGTGKDLAEYKIAGQVIPHHLIDIASPTEIFSLADFKKQAIVAIDDLLKRGKLPIVVGGTGLYLQALVDNYQLSEISPDLKLRQELEQKTLAELQERLRELFPEVAKKINESDLKNKRRLVRYLETLSQGQKFDQVGEPLYDWLIFGLAWPRDLLKQRIKQRLIDRLDKEGLVKEVEDLQKNGLSWERLESLGLEYRYVSRYLQNKLTYNEMVEQLNIAIGQFAKRQMSWYHRWERQGQKIVWEKDYEKALVKIKEFLE